MIFLRSDIRFLQMRLGDIIAYERGFVASLCLGCPDASTGKCQVLFRVILLTTGSTSLQRKPKNGSAGDVVAPGAWSM
jgi:hypothetical protein